MGDHGQPLAAIGGERDRMPIRGRKLREASDLVDADGIEPGINFEIDRGAASPGALAGRAPRLPRSPPLASSHRHTTRGLPCRLIGVSLISSRMNFGLSNGVGGSEFLVLVLKLGRPRRWERPFSFRKLV